MAPLSSITNDISESVDHIPEDFLCPLTLEIMDDPVVSKDGKNFDRRAILQWLHKGNDTCPLTRQPLRPSLLVPNYKLKMSIRKWKMDQGLKVDDGDDKVYCESLFRTRRSLMSMDCILEMTTTAMRHAAEAQQTSQPHQEPALDLADVLALYEEVLELTSDSVPSVTTFNDSSRSDEADLAAIVDEELKEIKDLYEEVYLGSTFA
jgi:hypothetical protein